MLTLAVVLTVVGGLVAFVAGPLVLADWIHARRRETIARQIAVTDAIHGELGAVVAPVVRRRFRGPWEVVIPVPFDRPALVERVLAIAHHTLAASRGGDLHIVLTPQARVAAPSYIAPTSRARAA